MTGDIIHFAGGGRHGATVPIGLAGADGAELGRGRFGRMFPFLPARDLDDGAIEALVHAMETRTGAFNDKIPAGYTYLGQFIDHDLTFDPLSQLGEADDPGGLADFRTPRLDLDSLYGSGPADQPFLYESQTEADRGVKLLEGSNLGPSAYARSDLPRNDQGRALIGDPRNDVNVIVSQLHLLFIRFHNKVVDWIRGQPEPPAGSELLREARRVVRWHYQWITAHDFLRHVVGEDMASSALEPGATWQPGARRFFRGENGPYIPVEFSAAAYRFGHSMVRDSYDVNSQTLGVPILPAGDGQHLGGFRRLPASLKIDWAFFFETRDGQVPQPSRLIDTNIAGPLFTLPVRVAPRPRLAWLNLQRGAALGLPTGIDVAQAMGAPLLSESELHLDDVAPAARPALLRAPPLWYYILCEARALSKGEYLGPVGGGIVAEVLLGLLEADPHSYLCGTPAWTPELPGTGGDFTMADLVRFAEPPGPA